MNPSQARSRHGLTAPMVRVKLRGFGALDRRMAGAREAMAFRRELVAALGGDADLSPQKRRLVELAARAALLLDAVDAWVFEQRSVVNMRTRALLPVVVQRQALAEHLAKLLDRLGLDRIPKQVTDLTTYVRERYGEEQSPVANDAASPAAASTTHGSVTHSRRP
jgi:hypothetical protein